MLIVWKRDIISVQKQNTKAEQRLDPLIGRPQACSAPLILYLLTEDSEMAAPLYSTDRRGLGLDCRASLLTGLIR